MVSGGGTGGHIMPGAAVADALARLRGGVRCLFLGTARETEDHCRPALASFEWQEIPAARWGGGLRKVRFGAECLRAAARSRRLMRAFRPHVLVGLGGYSCVAPVLAARAMGVPTMLFESNARPGRVVRVLARVADCVQVQWARAARELKARRVLVSGNPVREALLHVDRAEALRRLELDPQRRTLLVLGGSQGALALNRVLAPALKAATMLPGGPQPQALQVVHLTGPAHLAEALGAPMPPGLLYRPMGFLHAMGDAYAAADLALARAGGSTLAELTAVGLPSVLVPYPHAADRHQHANASVLAEAGAARCMDESHLSGARLGAALALLLTDPELLAYMRLGAQRIGRPAAAFTVAAELLRMAGMPLEQASQGAGSPGGADGQSSDLTSRTRKAA
jgi:UDP-N-acetylglucosamine--N-acetylmuramyl-(pentapeptide) pyrophosphoryl-undecaprenol N-acetylglucosamine transferase